MFKVSVFFQILSSFKSLMNLVILFFPGESTDSQPQKTKSK